VEKQGNTGEKRPPSKQLKFVILETSEWSSGPVIVGIIFSLKRALIVVSFGARNVR
jgi:hypothetical protein